MSEEEQIKKLTGKAIIAFIVEFEQELKDELKDFKIEIQPLYNGHLNADKRYSFIITSQLKENWKVEYDDWNKKYIVRRKK